MKISVIIPVLNEEACLGETLRRLRETVGEAPMEIVVVDGNSQDNSLVVADTLADKALLSPRAGRAVQMHVGALEATGDLLLFLHADTRLPGGWQRMLGEVWNHRRPPAATAFELSFDRDSFRYRLIAGVARWRSRLTRVPHGDQAIAVKRDLYFAVGGFPDVPLMEEYFLIRKLRQRGEVRILPGRVITSARRYEKNGPLWNSLRTSFLVALFYLRVPVKALARLYR